LFFRQQKELLDGARSPRQTEEKREYENQAAGE